MRCFPQLLLSPVATVDAAVVHDDHHYGQLVPATPQTSLLVVNVFMLKGDCSLKESGPTMDSWYLPNLLAAILCKPQGLRVVEDY